MRFPGFIGPTYQLNQKSADCQRLIGMFPEIIESGTGKEASQLYYRRSPGKVLKASVGSAHRGQWYSTTGKLYVVSGNKIYYVDSSFAETEIGTLVTYTGQVSMADNGIHLVCVDGVSGYAIELATNTFSTIDFAGAGFNGASQVVYKDGFFVFIEPNSQYFFKSNSNSIVIDTANNVSDASPDLLVAEISFGTDLWMFNEKTIEIYQDTGNVDFPFERIPGAFIEVGCAASFSVAKTSNTVFWLGQDASGTGLVYKATGLQPQKISTHAIDQQIQSYASVSDAVGFVYQIEGHTFYQLNFPSAKTSWIYDLESGMWHERCFNNQGVLERDRANSHTLAYGKHIVGDYSNGNLYELTMAAYDDFGTPIVRRRVAPHLSSGGSLVFYSNFLLDMEVGVGLDGSGQGTDPQVVMRFSNDGGKTWSAEDWKSAGKIGETKARPKWTRLGSARDRVFEITYSEPTEFNMIGADLDFYSGAS